MSVVFGQETALSLDIAQKDAFAWCRDVTRREARNFYYGLRLTPEPKRSGIYAVYAWMRAADDIVDEESVAVEARRDQLERFRARTEAIFAGERDPGAAGDPWDRRLWLAFGATTRGFGLGPGDFRDVFKGLEHDLSGPMKADEPSGSMFRTRAELEEYCYGVASTVGIICVRIWGVRAGADLSRAVELAAIRGLAFQLTNILRDIQADQQIGRVYIPDEDLEQHSLTASDLGSWSCPERCEAMVRSLGMWAKECYEKSSSLEEMLDRESVPAMWAMTRIYSELLDMILRDPARLISGGRIRLPKYQKAAIGIRAIVRAKRSRA